MRQKYRICQFHEKKILNIKEYAVIEKDTKNVESEMLRDDHFDLICEQNYDKETIVRSAAAGSGDLLDALRTPNLYPIAPYADKIVATVMEVMEEGADRCIELFFDDKEQSTVDTHITQ